jgi:hypothetical protein
MTQKTPARLVIHVEEVELHPFGDALIARAPQERVSEEVHQGIPALSSLADATVAVSNRLTNDARNALFFSAPGSDSGLREVAVEVALRHREEMGVAQPDIEYLRGLQPAKRQDYETAENDLWMSKPASSAD